MRRVAKRLKELEYQQTPVLVCPRVKQKAREMRNDGRDSLTSTP
jgi:hypothetical protein